MSIGPSEPAPEQPGPNKDEKDDYDDGGSVVINLVCQYHVQAGGEDDATMGLDLVRADRQATHVQWPLKAPLVAAVDCPIFCPETVKITVDPPGQP